jgi:5'-nucleotidase
VRVLLSNDDGVDAPGLAALYDAVSLVAETTVVAPASERSAVGHAISVYNNITLQTRERDGRVWAYAIDGTPADCVKMALTTIMKDAPPDLVISGVNRGQNTGTSILYSGTVAAALEATMAGFPAMAVSLAVHAPFMGDPAGLGLPADSRHLARTPEEFAYAARFAARLAQLVVKRGLPKGVLLNVNVPMLPAEKIAGVAISKMGHSVFVDEFKIVGETAGVVAYKNIGNQLIHSAEGDDWDDLVLRQRKISITPLHYDLTHHHFLEELRAWWAAEEQAGRKLAESVAEGLSRDLGAEVVG